MKTKRLLFVVVAFFITLFYINILPENTNSDTLRLACIHVPILLWSILGFTFVDNKLNDPRRRLDFLRYNADLIVMTTLLMLAGALVTGISFGLFELIDVKIDNFFLKYVVIWGLPAVPIFASYLVHTNPQLVNKISPLIARVFTPIVFLTLTIYLIAILYTGKDPYNNREFLLVFNVMLIGVMAIILFSISEIVKLKTSKLELLLLFSLALITIFINGIALSAIGFRISEWGITPNRLTVLVANLLILANLSLVTFRLYKTIRNRNNMDKVEKTISSFLPVYIVWSILVTFIFPLLFNFK